MNKLFKTPHYSRSRSHSCRAPAQRPFSLRPLLASLSGLLVCTGAALAAPFAYIPNQGSDNVSVIDLATNAVVGTPIGVGSRPFAVAVNPAGTLVYIANFSGASVSVISTASNTVVATITGITNPSSVVLNASGTRAYVTQDLGGLGSVFVIDTATNTLVGSPIVVSMSSYGLAVNAAGTRLYVTSFYGTSLSVIDTSSNTAVATVPGLRMPFGVTLNPAGTRAYIANSNGNTVSILDTATNTIVDTVSTGSRAVETAFNPTGTRAYVTNFSSDSVSVIDTTASPPVVIATIPVGVNPQGISMNADGTRVYVANRNSNTVSVIDTATNTVLGSPISVGSSPASIGVFIAQRGQAQSISFNPLIDLVLDSSIAVPVSASASSGLPVSISSQTPDVCTVNNTFSPATVVVVSAGTCTLVASQFGGGGYATATPVEASFLVGRSTVDVRTYLPLAGASSGYTSYLRVINVGKQNSALLVSVIDEKTGAVGTPQRLPIRLPGGAATIFNANQIEATLKLSSALAAGSRPRLRVTAEDAVPIEVQTLLRSPQGIFTEASGAQTGTTVKNGSTGKTSSSINVRAFVPSAAASYASVLRIINSGTSATPVTVARIDPLTGAVGTPGVLHSALPAGAAVNYLASQIEAALGAPLAASDRPRIQVNAAESTLEVQSYLAQPGGGFTEVSGAQTGSAVEVRSFYPASTLGKTSFVRIINASPNTPGFASAVQAELLDAAGKTIATGLLATALPGGAMITLTAKEIETAMGYAIPLGTIPRLRVSINGAQLEVQSYVLQPNAWLTLAANATVGRKAYVRTFMPQIDAASGYTSAVRVTNTGNAATSVFAELIDDASGYTYSDYPGVGKQLVASLAAGETKEFSAKQVEALFSIGLSPAESTRSIKPGSRPRLALYSETQLQVQSLLTQPGGVVIELSEAQ